VGFEIAAVAIHGVWWRQVPHGRDPVARPGPPRDARWQRGHVVDALDLAGSPETAWAEWYRWLAEYALAPAAALPRDLWRLEVDLEDVVDLRSSEALDRVGLQWPRPSAADWPAFQNVGERLAAEAHPALVGPSAARGGGTVLCVFWPPRASARVEPVGRPETVSEPPAPPRGSSRLAVRESPRRRLGGVTGLEAERDGSAAV
jgi:RES domain-containing protein